MKNFKIILFVIIFFIVIAGIFAVFAKSAKTKPSEYPREAGTNGIKLQPQTKEEGGVSVTVDPGEFEFKNPQFQISFDTHQGDLNFDLTKIAILLVDGTKEYLPLKWEGGQGGHHLSGVLFFPAFGADTQNMKLVIKYVYEAPEREFSWIF